MYDLLYPSQESDEDDSSEEESDVDVEDIDTVFSTQANMLRLTLGLSSPKKSSAMSVLYPPGFKKRRKQSPGKREVEQERIEFREVCWIYNKKGYTGIYNKK